MLWASVLLVFIVVIISAIFKIILLLRNIDIKLSSHFTVPDQPFIGSYFKFNSQENVMKNALEMTRKYGNALKINMFMYISGLIISDVKILEYILGTTSIIQKGYSYKFLRRWLGDGLLLSTGEKWKTSRKILTPAFHFQVLEEYTNNFRSSSEILVKKLREKVGRGSFDVYPHIILCTLDIICEAAMGTKVNAQENSSSEYVRAVKEMCELACDRAFSVWKMFDPLYAFSVDFWREKRFLRILHGYTKSVIEARKEEISKNKSGGALHRRKKMNLLDLLLQSNVDGRPLTNNEIQQEVDTFMFAGHDTTASAISFTLYCLSREQDVQRGVLEELDEIFNDDRTRLPTFQDLQNMKYLEMVIKETLRLYPSVPFYFRATDRETSYDKSTLPTMSQICIFAYGVHRDPANFPDPEKFDPDRFAVGNQIRRNPYSYIPFSAGPRNCIGQKFAILEIKYIVSNVLRNFAIHPVPDYDIGLIPIPVLKAKNGLHIRLTERD